MTTDLHSAVRTAVDEARRLAQAAGGNTLLDGTWHDHGPWRVSQDVFATSGVGVEDARGHGKAVAIGDYVAAFIAAWDPSRALAMCDWADDVLRRHRQWRDGSRICTGHTGAPIEHSEYPCAELISVAAAFGVETGETP